jgi:hypothetical protein
MGEFGCRQFGDLAAEVALNVLGARERERALRHLDGCARCSDVLRALTEVADGLVGSLPEAEPPAGFENRVVAALTGATPQRPRPLSRTAVTRVVAVLGAAALVGAGLVGEGPAGVDPGAVGPSPFNGSEERTVQYAPLMGENQQVGQAYLYRGDPTWIYLSLTPPKSTPYAGTVDCEVVHDDGTVTRVGTVTLDHGRVAWGGPAPAPPGSLVGARVVDHAGHTLAVARFRPRAARPVVDDSDHDTPQKRTTRAGQHPQ